MAQVGKRKVGKNSHKNVGAKVIRPQLKQVPPSSRLCVKNIPKYADEKRVREFFAKRDKEIHITDVKVLKKNDGKPRQMAFLGFKSVEDATDTLKYFNKAFFDTNRLSISYALPYKDPRLNNKVAKPTASASGEGADEEAGKKEKPNKKLAEFLALMQPRNQSQFWGNDEVNEKEEEDEEESSSSSSEEEEGEDGEDDAGENTEKKVAEQQRQEEKERKAAKEEEKLKEPSVQLAAESGRLFVRNLPFDTSEDELKDLFARYGPVSEIFIPQDDAKRSRGFGYVLYMIPEHAVKAIGKLDRQIFQGRLLHVMPALSKDEDEENKGVTGQGKNAKSSYKAKKEAELKEKAGDYTSWNSLFIRPDAAIGAVADQLGISKGELLLGEHDETKDSDVKQTGAAVRMAMSEARVIAETKKFLSDEGVNVELLEQGVRNPGSIARCTMTVLVKNLPAETDKASIRQMFAKFGEIEKFVMPPSKTMALIKFYVPKEAKRAFQGMAYKRYLRVPIYLEWAPEGLFEEGHHPTPLTEEKKNSKKKRAAEDEVDQAAEEEKAVAVALEEEDAVMSETARSLYIKNLNFETTEDGLRAHFENTVPDLKDSIVSVHIPKKVGDLSMGFGFIEFKDNEGCRKALRLVRDTTLDGHQLEVKVQRGKQQNAAAPPPKKRKTATDEKLASVDNSDNNATKLVVRNLAFEANKKELRQLVSAYGQVNSIRLPKKFDGSHRGFAFIDFASHQEAKTAFTALTSTHFYGRHLVIEWAQNDTSMGNLLNTNNRD